MADGDIRPRREMWPERRAEWFLRRMLKRDESYECDVLGTRFTILPKVFSPLYSRSTEFFARHLVKLCRGKTFLEIGTGSGSIAALAALHGATSVLATDCSDAAVTCARQNIRRHGLADKVRIEHTSAISHMIGSYDIVFFALPYVKVESIMPFLDKYGELAYSMCDEKYRTQRKFFHEARKYVGEKSIFVGFSMVGHLKAFCDNLSEAGISSELVAREREGRADNRLYQLHPVEMASS